MTEDGAADTLEKPVIREIARIVRES